MRFYPAWVSLGVLTVALNGCFQVGDDDASGGEGGQAGDNGKTGGSSMGGSAGNATGGGNAAGSSSGGSSQAGRDSGSSFLGRGGTKSSGGTAGKPASGGSDARGGSGGSDGGTDARGGSGGSGGSGKGGSGGTGGTSKGGSGGTGGSSGAPPTPEGTCDDYGSKLKSCGLVSASIDCSLLPTGVTWACFYGCVKEAPCAEVVEGICSAEASNALVDCVETCNSVVFDCGGGQTVPGSYECDGVDDCDNAKDEASCPPPSFACGDGKAVPSSDRCDGTDDCANGADEVGCPILTCPLPPAPKPGEACGHAGAALKTCGLLPSGSIQGCMDRTEARTCRAECFASASCDGLTAFFCSTGDAKVQKCLDDCDALSDEFPCKADNLAIPASWICDSTTDCSDGSDEAGCSFECGDGTEVPMSYLCDDEDDCTDGSDEASCAATCPAAT
jgi:hypothetical protein